MRLPSYLQTNQYGIYYFRVVFPQSIQLQLQRREFRRSLRTSNKPLAIRIAIVFKSKIDKIFNEIIINMMNWVKTKKVIDQVAIDILAEFKEYIFVHGAYPDNM